MRTASLSVACAAAALAGSLAIAQPQAKQEPPPRRNLQVLPQDIDRARLMDVMRGFTRSLGVECSFCHTRDFASDANPHKEAARGMMRMTARINAELLPAVAGLHDPSVTCFTCHRGSPHPAAAPPTVPPTVPVPPAPPVHIAPDTPAKPH